MDELSARLMDKSLVFELAYAEGQQLDLIAPGGTSVDDHRRGMIVFGPLTWSVLSSLWTVGYPARNEELGELETAVRKVLGRATGTGPNGEPVPPIRRALVLWRVLASLSQVLEEVAALGASIADWHRAGNPRGLRCEIGKRYLTWDAGRDGGIVQSLTRWTNAEAVYELLWYPSEDELRLSVSSSDAPRILGLARMSAELASTGFKSLVQAATPALRRTFVRYKHRITATSPGSAPIWLPHQGSEEWAAADERFASGFGVLDWQPRAMHPEIVLWPAADQDLIDYWTLLKKAFELLGLVIVSVARFGTIPDEPLPLLIPPTSELTDEDHGALKTLAQSDYIGIALARRFEVQR